MAATAFNTILSGSGKVDRSGLLQALEGRGAYVVAPDEDPGALDPGHATNLLFEGVLFWLDPLDTTTAHDATTCIVTADGKRFKADQFRGKGLRFIPVADKDLDTPPSSPSVGDSYIVAASATGDWAGKDKQIASWTARGWVFIAPNVYDAAYVIDEGVYYHYSASAAWTSGLPAITIGDDTLSTRTLKYGKFGQAVVDQTTNDPPESPSDGDAYIVGPVPTGAWEDNAASIARYEGSAWVIYAPQTGWRVYDSALSALIVWNGSSWILAGSGYIGRAAVYSASVVNPSDVGSGAYGFSVSNPVAPTVSQVHKNNPEQITYAAHRTGAELEFHFRSAGVDGSGWIIALLVDSDADAVDFCHATPHLGGSLRHIAPDTAEHVYTFAVYRPGGGAWGSWSRRWFWMLEVA